MAITTIPEITVSAISLPVYSFDFTAPSVDSPGIIELAFIDENKSYTLPEVSVLTPITIQVGPDYIYNYYLVGLDYNQSPSGGDTLKIKCADKSFLLDKIYVGLYTKHGLETDYPIVIVGDLVDPCQSIVDGSEPLNEVDDPCNPCTTDGTPANQGSPLQERIIQCAELRQIAILDVEYNFDQLIDELETNTPITFGDERPETNPDYKTGYAGTLREVLRSWCSDYSFTFFWDEDDVIQFIDLRNGIEINDGDMASDTRVLSKSYSKSLEGTVSKGIMGYFQKEGVVRDYKCDFDWCKRINLRPMNLQHVIGNPGIYQSLLNLQLLCVLSYYSSLVRDSFVWFFNYQVTSGTVLKSLVEDEPLEMHLLGMTVKKVFDTSDPADEIIVKKILAEVGGGEGVEEDFLERGGYIFVASYNETKHTTAVEFEASLANEFIGKYFVRKFTQSSHSASYAYLTPDADSVRYYKRTDPLQLPFVTLLKDDWGTVTDYLADLVDITTEEAADNFLLMERNGAWQPLKESEEVKSLHDLAEKEHFKPIGQVSLKEIGIELSIEDGDQFFIGYREKANLTINKLSATDHPLEIDNVSLPVETCGLGTVYGLRIAESQRYRIRASGGADIMVYMPVQGHLDSPTTSQAGYDIIWQKDSSLATYVVQPKIQLVKRNVPGLEENTMGIDINVQDITQDVYDLYNDDPNSLCEPRLDMINDRMTTIINGLKVDSTMPRESRTYVVGGLPNRKYLISEGLESMNIRMGGDGLETTIAFSNTLAEPITPDLFFQKYESMHKKIRPGVLAAFYPAAETSIADL